MEVPRKVVFIMQAASNEPHVTTANCFQSPLQENKDTRRACKMSREPRYTSRHLHTFSSLTELPKSANVHARVEQYGVWYEYHLYQ